MNILHLNTSLSGGAASGAYRLHEALKQAGHNSKIIVQESDNDDDDVIVIGISDKEKRDKAIEQLFLEKFKNTTEEGSYFFNPMPFFYNFNEKILAKIPFKPDLLIAHWTTWFADVETFSLISKKYNIPVIWYMSDMEPMTGGCHYNFSCNNYCTGCKECPGFAKYSHRVARKYFIKKLKYVADMDLRIVASSSYMLNKASESLLFKNIPKKLVLRGIDNMLFHPLIDKKDLRKKWGLVSDDIVIFFGAQSIDDKRKGMKYLLESLNILRRLLNNNQELLEKVKIIYAGIKGVDDYILPFKNTYAGFMKTQQDLASLYQVADMFICPSMQDSGPMMVSESLMCGTPVVGFKTGVLLDVIHDGKTGFAVEIGDSEGLAEGIKRLVCLSKTERQNISNICYKFAKNNLSYHQQVKNLISFMTLVDEK